MFWGSFDSKKHTDICKKNFSGIGFDHLKKVVIFGIKANISRLADRISSILGQQVPMVVL